VGDADGVDRQRVLLAEPPERGAPHRVGGHRDVDHPVDARDRLGELVGRVVEGPGVEQDVHRCGRGERQREPERVRDERDPVVEDELGRLERRDAGAPAGDRATAASTDVIATKASTRCGAMPTRRKRAAVTMPSVPSLPHSSDGRW
jgi:hypothetical protein